MEGRNMDLRRISQSAVFLALGMVLPFFTSQIKEIGDTLLPMHIPVMLCGLICGPQYGLTVGLILPLLRSVIFSMPPVYPNAVWMALELAAYGFVIGLLYKRFENPKIWHLYFCLIISMLSGRVVWGISKAALLGAGGKTFTIQAFIAGGAADAIPGIILQFVLIPVVMGTIKHIKNKEVRK